jgi:hypothetical protein
VDAKNNTHNRKYLRKADSQGIIFPFISPFALCFFMMNYYTIESDEMQERKGQNQLKVQKYQGERKRTLGF